MKNRKPSRALLLSIVVVSFVAAAVFVSPSSSGQARERVREDLGRVLGDFDALSFEPAALLARARKEGRLSLHTSRGAFELKVEPFDIRADNYRAVAAGAGGVTVELPRSPARWFKGEVVGVEGSRARFVLDERDFQGVIVTPGETYFVEPAAAFSESASRGDYVFYAASAVKPSAGGGECGTLAERVGAEAAKHERIQTNAAKDGPTEDAFAPKPETELATEADFEFTQTFPASADRAGAANNDILNVIAGVDAIYDAQLGIKIRVVFQRAWTADTDNYSKVKGNEALEELIANYNASFAPGAPPSRDLLHMFTGKNILRDSDSSPSLIGIAFLGVVCNDPGLSYGISESKFSSSMTLRVSLTAHEMGHNFGASHPNQQSPVPPSCAGVLNIMNSSIQSTADFCQFSRDQITNHVSSEGSCLTRLVQPGCAYALNSPSQFFQASGGAGSVGVTTAGGCDWGLAEGAEWIDTSAAAQSGPGFATFNVQPNTNTGPREASVDIAGQKLRVRQAASDACGSSQLAVGQTVSGNLESTDCRSGQPERPTTLADLYTFAGRAGQLVKIEMNAAASLDTFLYLFGPDGSIVASNDDIVPGVERNSRIPLSGFFALPQTGVYTIEATSFNTSVTTPAGYSVILGDNSSTNSVSFTGSAFNVSETLGAGGLGVDGSGFRVVNVTRAGDASGTAAVDFATSDGTAEQRKDYEQNLGTLVFGPGETSKTFTVFVGDDALAEGAETLTLTLSNPVGTTLGATTTATLTIDNNDAASASSPVRAESFDTAFFVRQQYMDFFSREPDAPGFAFWQNEITSCGSNAQCKEVKRVNVSGAFFLSIEFQNTGYLVYRFYKAAYGDATSPNVAGTVPVVRLGEFIPDTQRIGRDVIVGQGSWQQKLEANKQEFALEFVLRPRFTSAFPLTMTAAQFVDKLIQNSGVSFAQGERDQLIAQLAASADVAAGRAAVLRQLAEDSRLQAQERNRAFVLMQYFGYLRRNPDDAPQANLNFSGWRFWLDKLDQFGGNFVTAEMVKAFITSDEYVKRFGL